MDASFDVIYNTSTDPYFNLAAEEYLLDREDARPIFMLWRNDRAVIIGKAQNAYAEINEPFVREHGIKVVRRLTGGGAVFHDKGNVNYTFIVPREDGMVLNFAHFAEPIIDALAKLGAHAELSGRNDILIDGRKVSGNAQCVRGGRIMHHGTLLWSADMSGMAGALNVDPEKIASKGIKSVRSRVANIRELLSTQMSVEEFIDHLFGAMNAKARRLDANETQEIVKLRDGKYSRWEWNWGESRVFSAHRRRYFPFGLVDVRLDSERGTITDVSVTGDFFGVGDISELESKLRGARLERETLVDILSDVGTYISGASAAEICGLMLDPS